MSLSSSLRAHTSNPWLESLLALLRLDLNAQEAWLALCQHLNRCPDPVLLKLSLPHIQQTLSLTSWPGGSRVTPLAWTRSLMRPGHNPCAQLVHRVSLQHQELTPRRLERVLSSTHLSRATHLSLIGCSISDDGAQQLADCPRLRQLSHLNLASNMIGPAGVAALANSPYLSHLHRLELQQNPIGSEGLVAIAGFKHLRYLDLSDCAICAGGLSTLLQTHAFARLETLKLNRNPNSGARFANRQRPSTRSRLRHLELNSNNLQPHELNHLFASTSLPALRHLSLSNNPNLITDSSLCTHTMPLLGQLRSLELADSGLSPETLRQLAASPFINALQSLNIGHNNLELAGPHLFTGLFDQRWCSLEALDLSGTHLCPAAFESLASNASLCSLRHLHLSDTALNPRALLALASRFRHLDTLNLSNCGLHNDCVTMLTQAPGLSPSRLMLSHNHLSKAGLHALSQTILADTLLELTLDHNNLDADAATSFFSSRRLRALRKLSISCNNLQDRGARALIVSDMPNLRVLNIAHNQLSVSAKSQLLTWTRAAKLHHFQILAVPPAENTTTRPCLAPRYAPQETFQIQDFLIHPSWGLGLVSRLPAHDQIEVLFSSGTRTLRHNLDNRRHPSSAHTSSRPTPINTCHDRLEL